MSDEATPTDESDSAEPKIVVDDDWKAQVEKEKAAGSSSASDATSASANDLTEEDDNTLDDSNGSDTSVPTDDSSSASPSASADPQLPPATLEVHLSMLFSQCMVALGQMPGENGPGEINKPLAKHFIDTVEMLQSRTEPTQSDEEKQIFVDMLHAMRMAFVNARK